jgi:hypothetical protein
MSAKRYNPGQIVAALPREGADMKPTRESAPRLQDRLPWGSQVPESRSAS